MDDDFRNRFRRPSEGGPMPRPPQSRQPQHAPTPARTYTPDAQPAKPIVAANSHRPATPRPEPKQTASTPAAARKKKRKKSRLVPVIIFLMLATLAAAGGFVGYKKYFKKPSTVSGTPTSTPEAAQPQTAESIRLIATGDNLAFESINNAAKKANGSYDYLPLMANLKPFFDKSDVRVCNESSPAGGENLGLGTYPNFNAPTAWSSGFAALGCNVMNLGTDHTNDKGQPAIDAMLKTWDSQPNILAVAGANRSAEEQSKIRYFTSKGVKFAFLSYTTRTNNAQTNPYSINLYSDELAKKQLVEARKTANIVIVSMNWGNENSGDISTDQDRIAQTLAGYNADIIVGVGPHVLQPVKVLQGTSGHQTLAWFSLGSFISSQLPIENLTGGMAIMDINTKTYQIVEPKLLPFYMHYEWTAAQKKNQSSADLLARHGFSLYPLDQATEPLARSQNATTVQAQTERVTGIITKFVPVKVIKSGEF